MPRRDYQTGEVIAGTVYRVLKPIAAGGMGSVYEVEDTTVGKKYVLKTLLPTLGDRQDLARRMAAEARVLAKLSHPNIVEVITAGLTGDEMRLPYYVMERLEGLNVRTVLEKKGAFDTERAICIAIDLLDALAHAHDNGVIHRDVKPENIFLHQSRNGTTVTKLLDFGIMRMMGGTGKETGKFVGTLRYAAPEQLRGEELGPACDLYAAGLVLYEMLAGRGPFDDEGDVHKVAMAAMKKDPPPVTKFARVSPELGALVDSALKKSPADRPKDAFTFAAALRRMVTEKARKPDETLVNELAQLAKTAAGESVVDQAAGFRTTMEINTTALEMAMPRRGAPVEASAPVSGPYAAPIAPAMSAPPAGYAPSGVYGGPSSLPPGTWPSSPGVQPASRKGVVLAAFASTLVATVGGLAFLAWRLQTPKSVDTSVGKAAPAISVSSAPVTPIATQGQISVASAGASVVASAGASSAPFASPVASPTASSAAASSAQRTATPKGAGGQGGVGSGLSTSHAGKHAATSTTPTATQAPTVNVGPGF